MNGPPPAGRRALRLAIVLSSGALLASCITVDVGGRKDATVPDDRIHVVETPPAAAAPKAAGLPVVAVREFHAADRLGKRVLRREGDGRVAPLPRDYWADEPSRAVGDLVRETLAGDARFAAAVDATAGHRADLVLDGHLLEFVVDAQPSGPPRALVRLRLTWTSAQRGDVLLSRVDEAREDLAGPGMSGLGAAMSRALAKAVQAGTDAFAALPR